MPMSFDASKIVPSVSTSSVKKFTASVSERKLSLKITFALSVIVSVRLSWPGSKAAALNAVPLSRPMVSVEP